MESTVGLCALFPESNSSSAEVPCGYKAGCVTSMEPETQNGGPSVLKTVIWLVVLVLIVGGLVLWGKGGEKDATSKEPIKIGFIGPLTGDASSIGTVNRAAVELAVGEVNAAGGIGGRTLEVIYEDGKCNAIAAVNAAQKLINVDKVPLIIGGLCSTETAAFAPQAMQSKVIVFSYGSSAPNLSQTGKYFFRSYPSDAFQGKFGAEYAYNKLGAKKVAVVYHISDWGTGIKNVFVENFKALGGTVLAEEGAPQDARDYRTILTKVKGLNADLIYFPAYPDGTVAALGQAKDLGVKTRMLGGDGWDDPKIHTSVSGLGELLYSVTFSPVSDEFKAKLKAKTGSDAAPVGTTNAYDNVKIVSVVLAKVGISDPDKIADELRATKYDGVSGHISFDQNGDVETANYIVKKIEKGSATEVK